MVDTSTVEAVEETIMEDVAITEVDMGTEDEVGTSPVEVMEDIPVTTIGTTVEEGEDVIVMAMVKVLFSKEATKLQFLMKTDASPSLR